MRAKLLVLVSVLMLCGLSKPCTPVTGAEAARPGLTMPVLPEGLGVNIHFTDPKPGEMKMLAEGGFRWVRMDFVWSATEREKGKYDFSAYDRLLKALDEYNIKALFILDYTNRHYDDGLSPHSEEGRKAFARWAAAGVQRFRGRGILWEMYNEPNIQFWKPKPNPPDYIKLAIEVGKAIRQVAPEETYIGPATSQIDLRFLEECFKAGLLEYWDAVSVHPYRQKPPETVTPEYAQLRQLIARYAPPGKQIPILSGEWGYSAVWRNFNADTQGKYLPRQFLVNLMNHVPLSIWYDWHDDGTNPTDPEHHFGTVAHRYNAGRDPVYDPKPAYKAAQTFAKTLAGFRYNKRLAQKDDSDYVLLFSRQSLSGQLEVRLAAWTTAAAPREIELPASPGRFNVVGHLGEALPELAAEGGLLRIRLTDAPQYLIPKAPNELLLRAARWESLPLEQVVKAPTTVGNVEVLRGPGPLAVRLPLELPNGTRYEQLTHYVVSNPLQVTIFPPVEKTLWIRVHNPSGAPSDELLWIDEAHGVRPVERQHKLRLAQGQQEALIPVGLQDAPQRDYRVSLAVRDAAGRVSLRLPDQRYQLVDDFARYTDESLRAAYRIVADGDAKVGSEQSIALASPPHSSAGAAADAEKQLPFFGQLMALRVKYRFDAGWKFVRVTTAEEKPRMIEGKPKAVGMWLYGDGSGNSPRLRLVDSTGQVFQPTGPQIDWRGWRYVTLVIDDLHTGHWGGANDGVMHYPLRWDTLFLLDSARRQKTEGEVYIAVPTLIY